MKKEFLSQWHQEKRRSQYLSGTPEQNTWSKPLIWFPGARNREVDDEEWRVVGPDGQVVGVERNMTQNVAEVQGKAIEKSEVKGAEEMEKGDGRDGS